MVSSTKAVKRYYPPEVRAAVTELLISRERHQVAFVRTWCRAVAAAHLPTTAVRAGRRLVHTHD
jgi:hypothetical protein